MSCLAGISCSLPGGLSEGAVSSFRKESQNPEDTWRSAFMTQDRNGLGKELG